jgi:hypothetical protein
VYPIIRSNRSYWVQRTALAKGHSIRRSNPNSILLIPSFSLSYSAVRTAYKSTTTKEVAEKGGTNVENVGENLMSKMRVSLSATTR